MPYFFFDPPSPEVLDARMRIRGISPDEQEKRMTKIKWYADESAKTDLTFTHLTNNSTIPELIMQEIGRAHV